VGAFHGGSACSVDTLGNTVTKVAWNTVIWAARGSAQNFVYRSQLLQDIFIWGLVKLPVAEKGGLSQILGRDSDYERSGMRHKSEPSPEGNFLGKKVMKQPPLSYTAYGGLWARPDVSLGFNGEWKNEILQAYGLGQGHRFYSPALMRFLSPDALSPFGEGGVNTYCYCVGDPINRLDPSGQSFMKMLMPGRKTGSTEFAKKVDIFKGVVKAIVKYADGDVAISRRTHGEFHDTFKAHVAGGKLFYVDTILTRDSHFEQKRYFRLDDISIEVGSKRIPYLDAMLKYDGYELVEAVMPNAMPAVRSS